MKCTFFTYLAILLCSASAWSGNLPQKQATKAMVSRQDFFLSFAFATHSFMATTSKANAAGPEAVFNHQYSDPKHPNCKRIVAVKSDGTAAISGTDGTPGCPEDGSGKVWRLPAEVEGNTIFVDFSAKGGPENLKGTWDGSGIKWPDGNKWTVKN